MSDEFDEEVTQLLTRREIIFVYRYGMNVTSDLRRAADEEHHKIGVRLREIAEIRAQRVQHG